MYDVITVGSATVDVFAYTKSELIKIKTESHEEDLIAYPCGSKILMEDLRFLTGGGGTNVGVSLSRLGHKVGYIGKVGNDINGKMILKMLKDEHVDFLGKIDKERLSGYSVILDGIEGDRTILAHKGANNFLKSSEVNKARLDTRWFYFSSMVDESYMTLESIAEYAGKKGISIAFNPSNYLAEKGSAYLKKVLSNTTLLILNKEEAALLVGDHSPKDLSLKIMELGPKIVIVTDGKEGAYTVHDNTFYHIIPHNVKVKETTGAGDSFAAGFLSGWLRKKGIEYSLCLGLLNAESVIQQVGAKAGLLMKKDAERMMRTDKFRIDTKKLTARAR